MVISDNLVKDLKEKEMKKYRLELRFVVQIVLLATFALLTAYFITL